VEEEVRRMQKVVLWQRELDLPISDTEVEWGMKNMKADELIPEMVKYGGKVMKEVLGIMFRLFWSLEKQPEDWKKGDIFPIYKKGDVTDIGNYGGITLLSVVGKMMEASINRRVYKWTEERKRLRDEQGGCTSGLRRGRGLEMSKEVSRP
jgi:hypothetical protein